MHVHNMASSMFLYTTYPILSGQNRGVPTPQATSSSRHRFHWSGTAAAVFHTGSLHAILIKYCKLDASVGPLELQQTALQVTMYLYMQHNHCLSPLQKFLILWG